MSGGDPSGALRDIQTLFSDGMLGSLTDKQLLERFANRKDSFAEDAFTIILARHGPMVWSVCRRLSSDRYAAEDAFQATFLVLVRRASTVRIANSLGPWLYGVSRRVAARARASSLRRMARETGSLETVSSPAPDPDRAERLLIVDEEIDRLPERQRTVVVLCDVEGRPHVEVANQLGCPVGTVESRLSRGRQRLRDRLAQRGFAPPAVPLWAAMLHELPAAMPAALITRTARFVATASVAGAVPGAVTALADGVIQMMWLTRLKPLVAVATALILATVGVAVLRPQPVATRPHKITVVTIQPKDVTITQSYVCQLNAAHYIEVRAPVSGYIKDAPIREGQTAKRGDLLFQVSPLLKNGDKRNAENQGKMGSVKAPFDGMLGRLRHPQGSLVKAHEALTSLFDNHLMWAYFNVPEAYYLEYKSANLDQHKDDLKIELVLPNGDKFAQLGTLGAIGADFNAATGNVPFRADFPNPAGLLRHGQSGNVMIGRTLKGAIAIPQRATFEKLSKRYIYAVDKEQVAHAREIIIQNELDDLFVLKKGVEVGERIVDDGIRLVHDGDKVRE